MSITEMVNIGNEKMQLAQTREGEGRKRGVYTICKSDEALKSEKFLRPC